MDTAIYVILILIIIFGIIAIIHIASFNKIQRYKIRIEEAEAIIDENIRKRFDTLGKIFIHLGANYDINASYFKDYNNLKDKKISNFDLDRKITENVNLYLQLKSTLSNINDDKIIIKLDNELRISEEHLESSKAFYNNYTSKLNILIKSFPTNIVANMHHVKVRQYFDGKDLCDDDINDFKL